MEFPNTPSSTNEPSDSEKHFVALPEVIFVFYFLQKHVAIVWKNYYLWVQ